MMVDKEIELIKEVNADLAPLVEKYGIENLKFCAQWLFIKSSYKSILKFKDRKGWTHEQQWNIDSQPPQAYYFREYPDLTPKSFSSEPEIFHATDVCFRMVDRKIEKLDCGCKIDTYYYEEY